MIPLGFLLYTFLVRKGRRKPLPNCSELRTETLRLDNNGRLRLTLFENKPGFPLRFVENRTTFVENGLRTSQAAQIIENTIPLMYSGSPGEVFLEGDSGHLYVALQLLGLARGDLASKQRLISRGLAFSSSPSEQPTKASAIEVREAS